MRRTLWPLCLLFLLTNAVMGCALFAPAAATGQATISTGESLDLPAIRLRFKNESARKRVRLVIERDGVKRNVVLVLRDLV